MFFFRSPLDAGGRSNARGGTREPWKESDGTRRSRGWRSRTKKSRRAARPFCGVTISVNSRDAVERCGWRSSVTSSSSGLLIPTFQMPPSPSTAAMAPFKAWKVRSDPPRCTTFSVLLSKGFLRRELSEYALKYRRHRGVTAWKTLEKYRHRTADSVRYLNWPSNLCYCLGVAISSQGKRSRRRTIDERTNRCVWGYPCDDETWDLMLLR